MDYVDIIRRISDIREEIHIRWLEIQEFKDKALEEIKIETQSLKTSLKDLKQTKKCVKRA